MAPDQERWAKARAFLGLHGGGALTLIAQRIIDLARDGDEYEVDLWREIVDRVSRLQQASLHTQPSSIGGGRPDRSKGVEQVGALIDHAPRPLRHLWSIENRSPELGRHRFNGNPLRSWRRHSQRRMDFDRKFAQLLPPWR